MSELEDVYDERTLAALDAAAGEPRDTWQPPARRGGLGAALVGMALGLREVFDPNPPGEAVVELRPDPGEPDERWVTFVHVPGAPTMSRVVVRPWLAPDR